MLPGFLAGQRATATERQRQVKLPDPWLSQIEGFLESAPLTPGQQRVLLHTEVIREHLVVNPGTWTLSGLLDFERAMTGDRAYEFAAAGLFVSCGDPRLLGRMPRRACGPARAHAGLPGPNLVRYRLDRRDAAVPGGTAPRTWQWRWAPQPCGAIQDLRWPELPGLPGTGRSNTPGITDDGRPQSAHFELFARAERLAAPGARRQFPAGQRPEPRDLAG